MTSGAHTKVGEARLGGIGAVVSAEIEKYMGKESRVCVLGHLQRGGSPTTFDRALCSIFGATAVELVAARRIIAKPIKAETRVTIFPLSSGKPIVLGFAEKVNPKAR